MRRIRTGRFLVPGEMAPLAEFVKRIPKIEQI